MDEIWYLCSSLRLLNFLNKNSSFNKVVDSVISKDVKNKCLSLEKISVEKFVKWVFCVKVYLMLFSFVVGSLKCGIGVFLFLSNLVYLLFDDKFKEREKRLFV